MVAGHGMTGVWMCTQYYCFFANVFSTRYTGQRTAEVRAPLTMWTLDGRLRLSGAVVDAFVY